MATAHQIRDLITETTTATVRPRAPREERRYATVRRRGRAQEPLRQPVRAGDPCGRALLLADRVGKALRRRAAGLPAGGDAAGRSEPRGGDARPRPQGTDILREIGAGPPGREMAILAEDLPLKGFNHWWMFGEGAVIAADALIAHWDAAAAGA